MAAKDLFSPRRLASSPCSLSSSPPVEADIRADGSLAPTLLYTGSYWGEAALVGDFPLTCSVRAVERCVLLVLRRGKVQQHLAGLPLTAREAWQQEAQRTLLAHQAATSLWRRRRLIRVPILRHASSRFLHALNSVIGYRVVPARTPLLHQGRVPRAAFLIVLGEVEVLKCGTEGSNPSRERIAFNSDIPVVGMEALLEERDVPLAYSVVTRTDCQLLPLTSRELGNELLAELNRLLEEALEQPKGLVGRIERPRSARRDCELPSLNVLLSTQSAGKSPRGGSSVPSNPACIGTTLPCVKNARQQLQRKGMP